MLNSAEFKVGLFVLVCVGLIAAMSFQVNRDPSILGKGKMYDALLISASGLVKSSNVKMAGIPVGVIKDIVLEDGKARVIMTLRGDLKITKSGTLEIKPNGILGDKYLEITTGNPSDEVIPEGGRVLIVYDKGGFDAVLNQVSKIASDVSEVTNNLKNATTGDGDATSPIGRILLNIEDVTADLRDITGGKKDKIGETIDSIHRISQNIDEFVGDDSEDGFKHNWKKMAKSLGKVDSILSNVDEITGKVNSGKGTIGKLINDETTVEELNHAIAGVNNMLDTANKFQVSVDYHSEYMGGGGSFVKSYIGINIQPGPDRYYLVQVVDDPKGNYERVDQLQTTNNGAPTATTTKTSYHNKLKLSAQFAKNFYDMTLRAGLIENSAGAGMDYSFLNRKLKFSAEAFAFGRPEGVDLRVFAKYKFYSVFYAIIGGDDILNTKGNVLSGTGASGFIGAGLDFTNDDLKLLLTKVPF
ncbi:MAG: MlaD family protein [Oligoflexia bacterium]|nr:MlaD family protein [Oligoflexia bacterium]